jgi:adenylylsulfate kinase
MKCVQGQVIWLTGLPAAGKTTLAGEVVTALRDAGWATLWLDSDNLRRVLTPNPTFTEAERDFFYGAVGEIAALGADGGVRVVVSATAGKRSYRDRLRKRVNSFVEILVTCDRETRLERDPKGLYSRSSQGEISSLPGEGSAYEAPTHPELTIDTTNSPAAVGVQRITELANRIVDCHRAD